MSELGPDTRAIFEEGRHGDDPTAVDRARVRAKLMQAVVAAGAGAAATAVGKSAAASIAPKAVAGAASLSGGGSVVAKVVAVVVLASAVGGGAYGLASGAATPVAPAPAATAAAPQGRPADPVSPERPADPVSPERPVPSEIPVAASADPAAGDAPAAVVAAPASDTPARAKPSSDRAADAKPVDPLQAEARRLRAAHDAIQQGDAQRALDDLDAQSRAYPAGQLGEERSATRVLALCKLGRVEEAKAAAARFVAAHPRSPLVDRLRNNPCNEPR